MATAKWSHVTRENTNFARLCKLLIDGGTHVLKEVFDKIHPLHLLQSHLLDPGNHAILQTLKTRRILFQKQWDKLYPSGGSTVTSSSFDITLLCLLLRNICKLPSPTAGNWNATPAPKSTTTEDDIVRVKQFRNHLYGHITEPALSDTDFNQYWDDIASVLVRLGGSQAEIDKLKHVSMDPEDEEYYIQFLEEWNSSEERLWKYLEAILEKLGETHPSTGESKFQDPLMYSQNLKRAMKDQLENYQECALSPIIEKMKIDDIFTNLVMKQRQTKHSTSSRPDGKVLSSKIPRGAKSPSNLSQSDIFPIKESKDLFFGLEKNGNPKSILISGKPGIGKSLYCRKLVHEWAQDTIFESAVNDNHPDIKFTFLLTFRQLNMLKEKEKELNLRELLNHCSTLDESLQINDSVMQYIIDHPEHLFIILDGYDEYQDKLNMDSDFESSFKNDPKSEMPVTALISKLLKKKILRDSVVMVTSRPGEADEMEHVHFDRYVEIAGFSEEQVVEYVEKYFKSNEELKIKALDSIKDNQDYLNVGRVPLMCLFMCVYMEEHIPKSGEGFPKTLTAFYTDVLQYILKNYTKALKVAQLDETTTSLAVQKIWTILGELAAELSVRQRYSFDDNDLKNLNLSKEELSYIKSCSLLFCEAGVRKSLFSEIQHQYSFTHTTIQEYFAARHFVLMNEIPAHATVSSMVLQFMAGSMDPEKDGELMEKLLESIQEEVHALEQPRISLNYLYEYGDVVFAKSVVQKNPHNTYWDSNGGRISLDLNYKVVVMLIDIITTLNQEQLLSTPSCLPHRLSIHDSHLNRSGVESLFTSLSQEFCTITELQLYRCKIDDVGAQCLSKYLATTKLNKLELPVNRITDKGLVCIVAKSNDVVTHLGIGFNDITDDGLVSIAPYCNNLIHLDIGYNKITDKGLESIAPYCNNLTHLDIAKTNITDKGLMSITQFSKNLTFLNIRVTQITDKGLVSIAPYCNNLTHLDMAKNNIITDKGLVSITQHCKNLTYLNMRRNQITDEGLKSILQCCDKLTNLHMMDNLITGMSLEAIVPYCNNNIIQNLDMDGNKITDEGLVAILRCCHKLIDLSMRYNEITDNGVYTVLPLLLHRNQQILIDINLAGNKITDECKERVREMLKDKPHINIDLKIRY